MYSNKYGRNLENKSSKELTKREKGIILGIGSALPTQCETCIKLEDCYNEYINNKSSKNTQRYKCKKALEEYARELTRDYMHREYPDDPKYFPNEP